MMDIPYQCESSFMGMTIINVDILTVQHGISKYEHLILAPYDASKRMGHEWFLHMNWIVIDVGAETSWFYEWKYDGLLVIVT